MIKNIGIDIESIKKFKALFKTKKLIRAIFSEKEMKYCEKKKNPFPCLTGKFCAKEALIKALDKKVSIRDIEILNSNSGKPVVFLNGKKLKKCHCSITHSDNTAESLVILEK